MMRFEGGGLYGHLDPAQHALVLSEFGIPPEDSPTRLASLYLSDEVSDELSEMELDALVESIKNGSDTVSQSDGDSQVEYTSDDESYE
jgi:hypothetical protein